MKRQEVFPLGLTTLFALSLLFALLTPSLTASSALSPLPVQASPTAILVNESIRTILPSNAKWSLSAIEIETGNVVTNSDATPLVPGSLIKLFVTAAALSSHEKQTWRLETVVAQDGSLLNGVASGNLYLKGRGNGFLSERDFLKCVDNLYTSGLRVIKGDVVVDESMYVPNNTGKRPGNPSEATSGAVGLDLHTVSLTKTKPRTVSVSPVNDTVRVIFDDNVAAGIRQIDDFSYIVSGSRTGGEIVRKRFSIHDPGFFAGSSLMTILRERGITVAGTIRKGVAPPDVYSSCRIEAPALPEMVRLINHHSINLMAENLLLYLGASTFGQPGTTQKGLSAIGVFLDGMGIAQKDMHIADGAGLSHDNLVSAAQLSRFLAASAKTSWFDKFYKSLPRVGLDGNLRSSDYRSEKIRVKTGMLADVFALAGYIEGKKFLAFAFIANTPGADLLWNQDGRIIELLGRLADE